MNRCWQRCETSSLKQLMFQPPHKSIVHNEEWSRKETRSWQDFVKPSTCRRCFLNICKCEQLFQWLAIPIVIHSSVHARWGHPTEVFTCTGITINYNELAAFVQCKWLLQPESFDTLLVMNFKTSYLCKLLHTLSRELSSKQPNSNCNALQFLHILFSTEQLHTVGLGILMALSFTLWHYNVKRVPSRTHLLLRMMPHGNTFRTSEHLDDWRRKSPFGPLCLLVHSSVIVQSEQWQFFIRLSVT